MAEGIAVETKAKATSKPRMSRAERRAMGKALRTEHPRTSHAAWQAPADRPDPLDLLKASAPSDMDRYAELCGWTLARAHARSGEPAAISGYLGSGDTFDRAIADFSIAYADQSERDHARLMKAVRAGKLKVSVEPN